MRNIDIPRMLTTYECGICGVSYASCEIEDRPLCDPCKVHTETDEKLIELLIQKEEAKKYSSPDNVESCKWCGIETKKTFCSNWCRNWHNSVTDRIELLLDTIYNGGSYIV